MARYLIYQISNISKTSSNERKKMQDQAKSRDRRNLALNETAHMSLRDHVRQQLRMAIISGSFAPGERLNERMLAEELGVSTTPLKEALRQLDSEGLIETVPRRGLIVRFDAEFAEEMIHARSALESALAAMAAERADQAVRDHLREIVEDMARATEAGDVTELIALNEAFHGEIHTAARSRHITRLAAQQQLYDDTARRVIHRDAGESRSALEEHTAIYEAIVAGDAEAASDRMSKHVLRSGRLYLSAVFNKDRRDK